MEIKRIYPEVWHQFVALEDDPNIAYKKFDIYGKSLHEIDRELELVN